MPIAQNSAPAEEIEGSDGSAPRFPADFNLADYFLYDRLKEGLGDKVALRWGGRDYRYADVARETDRTAALLASVGVAPERVYLVLPDTPPFAWAFFGTLRAGAVVTLGNPDSPVEDLAYVLDYVRARALVTVPRVASALAPFLSSLPSLKAVLLVPEVAMGEDVEAVIAPLDPPLPIMTLPLAGTRAPGDFRPPAIRRDHPAIWLFTSGSTGRPKAAMHTHRDFAFNTEVYAKRTVGYRRDDVTVSAPRLYFGYATGTNLMFPFAVGATVGLFPDRPTPETLARAIDVYRPTIVTNVPTLLGKLLEHDDALRAAGRPPLDFSSIRFHLSAGEALPPPLLARFQERFKNDVYDGIGSAEMFHIYCSNRPGDVRPGSLGKAVEGYALRVLPEDADGAGATPVPVGEIGVLWVAGDSVALGYHDDRDKSWRTFHGRWCRTGDLFSVDEAGYLWFAGRADELLKVSGLWVAPLEVEGCLAAHPAVAEAAVIGADDGGLQKPKAFVVLRPSALGERETLRAELQEHVKARLSKHKYPRWIVFVDELPRNDRGKVDKKSLKAQGAHEKATP